MNPELPTIGSTMIAAIARRLSRTSCVAASRSLNGAVSVSVASSAGTPGESGRPSVATPDPA